MPATTTDSCQDDSETLVRLRLRDTSALAELYDRHGRVVYSLILRIVQNVEQAEDLTQEVFLRLWTRTQLIDLTRGELRAWLLAVARNSAIDYYRSTRSMRCCAMNIEEMERMLPRRPGSQAKPHVELCLSVLRALTGLNDSQRQILELSYFQGMSQTEISIALHLPLGTVKTWMRSALATLRDGLIALPASSKENTSVITRT